MTEADFWRQIASGDDTARLALADFLEERGDVRAAWVRDAEIARHMLPDGRDPLPSLIDAVFGKGNPPRRYQAAECLGRQGGRAMPAVINAIVAGRGQYVGLVLAQMTPGDIEPFADRLFALASDGGGNVCPQSLVEAIRLLGPAARPAMDALIGMLPAPGDTADDYYVGHGLNIAEVLAHFGVDSLPAARGLTRLVLLGDFPDTTDRDPDSAERLLAVFGRAAAGDVLDGVREFGRVRPHPVVCRLLNGMLPEVLSLLRGALGSDSPAVRATAAVALVDADPGAAMPVLVAALVGAVAEGEYAGELVWAVVRASRHAELPADALRPLVPRLDATDREFLAVAGLLTGDH